MIRVARYVAVLVVMIASARVIGVVVHEYVGHGAACLYAGGTIGAVRIGLGGGGLCPCRHPRPELATLLAAAGIAVDLVLGTIAFGLARRVRSAWLALFFIVLTGAEWLLAFYYLAFGLFFGVGDPISVVDALASDSVGSIMRGERLLWVPFALALPAVAFVAARLYPRLEAACIGPGPLRRSLLVLASTGAALLALRAALPTVKTVDEQALVARGAGRRMAEVHAVITATRAELGDLAEPKARDVLVERLQRIPRPAPEPGRVRFVELLLSGLAGLGALGGVISGRARIPTRGAGAASPPPPPHPLPAT